ncbi:MAG: LysM peptidoglycan-binding domain-containing protein [Gammaproteobacteria bacterium]|nr:MAG: LysM peptidoglycan-binding domain-containing protein [Gammaproteobacteria bacterium]
MAAERRWYVEHPAYLERLAQRAAPYLGYILDQVEERGMPAEIALLPAVESAFQPFAYSPGRAAGLWQFIPGTARRYGLRLSWWYDGRRDLVDATRAALDYLEHLRDTFHGDWLLALAAYNAGEGTVLQALRRNRRRGRPADFWSLDLPRETRQYVPRLLALASLVAQPARYGVRLPPLPADRRLAVVETGSQIDLALAAELAGMELEELYRLNPGFNRWATDPDGPHRLVLPAEKAAAFRQALARVPPERRVQWRRHRIRPGETLGGIARRYRTTVALLRRVNGLRGHLIRAGDHLLVPMAARRLSDYALSALARREARLRRPRGAVRLVHVIQPGDTLWELARRYGVPLRRLAAWNGMAPGDLLHPGQELVIWKGRPGGRAPALARVVERKILYVVRPGDSLARISQRFRVSVRELARWNDLDLDDYIHPGQRLTLYVDVTRLAESG